jgi:hypothetical protein
MATVIVPPSDNADPSLSDLRAMIGGTTVPVVVPAETKPEITEPVADEATTKSEADSEPADTKKEPEDSEEPLPKGVQKKIEAEARKQAEIQARIDRAVSERKAKESELAKLEGTGKGSEPVKTPQPASSEKPKRPVFGEAGHESETYGQFEVRAAGHDDKLAEWVKGEAVREFKASQEAETAKAKATERWDTAVKKHGDEFPALMDKACAVAPQGLQLAISGLENWSDVAVHLAKNPAQLQELSAKFESNPYAVIATLGRIEASLTSKVTTPAATEKPLPEPLAKVGGNASASGKDFQSIIQDGSFSQLKAAITKIRGK